MSCLCRSHFGLLGTPTRYNGKDMSIFIVEEEKVQKLSDLPKAPDSHLSSGEWDATSSRPQDFLLDGPVIRSDLSLFLCS